MSLLDAHDLRLLRWTPGSILVLYVDTPGLSAVDHGRLAAALIDAAGAAGIPAGACVCVGPGQRLECLPAADLKRLGLDRRR